MSNVNRVSLLTSAVFIFIATAATFAQNQSYAYVSAENGSDESILCERTTPCRQINKALSVIADGGTIKILTDGSYDGATISKSATIIGLTDARPLIRGLGISQTSGIGVRVTLRGVGIGTAPNSFLTMNVYVTGGAFLRMEDCTIYASETGINLQSGGQYYFHNVQFINGIYQLKFSSYDGSLVTATVDDCEFVDNGYGITAEKGARVTVTRTRFNHPLTAVTATGAFSRVTIDGSVITDSQDSAVLAQNMGMITVTNSTFTNSGNYALENRNGILRSYGNNRLISSKTADTFGTVTTLTSK